MKSICFLLHNVNGSGGDTRVATSIINGIVSKENWDITVLSVESVKKYRQRNFTLDSKVKVDCITEKISNTKKEFLSISLKIRDYFTKNRFDVLVVSGMDFVPFIFLSLSRLKGVKKIAWEHMNYNVGGRTSLIKIGRNIALRKFDKIIVITERDKRLYECNSSKSVGKIVQIYNPLNFPSDEDLEAHIENKRILSSGFLVEQKGFDFAIEIAKTVLPKFPEWSWEIWGGGPLQTTLEKQIEEADLDGRVKLMGYTDAMLQKYKDYSVFALTSRFEGFGMVLAEALHFGLPSIAFDIDVGPDEMIEDGVNGYLIKPFDTEQFSNRLIEIMNDVKLRERMKTKSDVKIRQMNYLNAVDKWVNVLK